MCHGVPFLLFRNYLFKADRHTAQRGDMPANRCHKNRGGLIAANYFIYVTDIPVGNGSGSNLKAWWTNVARHRI